MTIKHHAGQYDVDFVDLAEIRSLVGEALTVTDSNVQGALGISGQPLILPPGESTKTLEHFERVIDWLVDQGAKRSSVVHALGGGVIGDLVGYVASSYMRGIPYVQVPTTLLAMVDSSVGGKVAVDHPKGKNLIGAFHAPSRVLIAIEALENLPERQIRNGMAEVLKYGFIEDPGILDHQEPSEALIRRCIEIKAEVVEQDEFETNGRRAILNFGHTIGHAIETSTGYSELLHGEAISIGMVAEAKLSELIGLAPTGTTETVRVALSDIGLPIKHELLKQPDILIGHMKLDKKRTKPGLAFSLLTKIGACKLIDEVPVDDVIRACESI